MTTYHPDQSTDAPNGEDTQTLADSAREQLETRRAQMGEAAAQARQQVTGAAQRGTDQGAQFVRDNPALALAGAAGVGLLLGLALRPRD